MAVRRASCCAMVAAAILLGGCSGGERPCPEGDKTCEPSRSAGLSSISPEARSCEVLLEDGAARVTEVRFAGSATGVHIRQAPRTAVTFHATLDAPMSPDDVRIEVIGDGDFRITRADCFDRTGLPLASSGIPLDD